MTSHKNLILDSIKTLEKEKNIIVLYAIDAGSRAWNMHCETKSDYDIRFLFIRLPVVEQYLSLLDQDKKDTIEGYRGRTDSLHDMSGWDFRKALVLLGKSNIDILEWIQSPVVYRSLEDEPEGEYLKELGVVRTMRNLASEYYSRKELSFSYIGMAKKRFHEASKTHSLKKYLYAVRSLLVVYWMNNMNNKGLPPLDVEQLLADIDPTVCNEAIRQIILHLVKLKRDGSSMDQGVISDSDMTFLIQWIETSLKQCQLIAKTMTNPKQNRRGDYKRGDVEDEGEELSSNKLLLDELFLNTLKLVHKHTTGSSSLL